MFTFSSLFTLCRIQKCRVNIRVCLELGSTSHWSSILTTLYYVITMGTLAKLTDCLFGPRLYSFYKLTGHTISSTTPEVLSRSHKYQSSPLESASDYILRVSKIITYFGAYVSPVIFTYLLYKRNVPGSLFNSLDQSTLLRLFATAVSILFGSFCVRGFARYSNPEYAEFIKALEAAHKTPSPSNKRVLVHFNAEFSAYPIDFRWSEARDQRSPSTLR